MKNVKVLGTGCRNCQVTYRLIEEVARAKGVAVELEKVEKIDEIMAYGVMMTPALVVDGEVKSSGRIPAVSEIASWLTTAAAKAST